LRTDDNRDLLRNAGRELSPVPLPETLAGLPRRALDGAPPAVGLYGRGVTLLAVVPLPAGPAGDLRRAAGQDPAAAEDELGIRFSVGPVGLLLATEATRTTTLLAGTVTADALHQAATELAALAGRP
ncbi:MAG: transcriptional regulator, partial [Thermoleophilaceae bacterium]